MFSADLGVNQVASTPAATDPPFQKVALLLHGDGTNGAQNNTFVDSSTNNFTITRTGNVAQGTFSPFSVAEGQWSNFLDGTGDYLTVTDSSAFAPGTGAFTWECWFYPTGVWAQVAGGGDGLWYSSAINGIQIGRTDTATGNAWGIASRGTAWRLTTTTLPNVNQWNHMVVVRSGTGTNETAIFLNGVRVANGTVTASFGNSTGALEIGRGGSGYESTGYLSNVRFVNGSAIYDPTQSTLTVPTAPLTAVSGTSLLTCQSNRFIDNSSNNFTITRNGDTKVTAFSPFAPSAAYDASTNGGSGYFDGSGDYLSAADNANLRFGTSAFTIQAWVYRNAAGTAHSIVSKGGASTGFTLGITSTNVLRFTDTTTNIDTTTTIPAGTWTHVAAVRTNTSTNGFQLYINGVSSKTATVSTDFNQTNTLYVGADRGAANVMNGYITDLRYVNGTAETITVPTAPLTAVTNTQLLLNCTNAGIIDNAGKNDIETVGNAQISTSVKKYGTGSMYFDGAGDYLTFSPLQNTAFGTGDFTVEFWTNFSNASGSNFYFIDTRNSGQTANWAIFRINTGNTLNWYTGATQFTGPIFTTTNVWTHVAFSRSGTSLRLFIDGVLQNTFTDTTNYSVAPSIAYVGTRYTAAEQLNGYIDDFRITKGQALYTSNFTPPTQAFPNV